MVVRILNIILMMGTASLTEKNHQADPSSNNGGASLSITSPDNSKLQVIGKI